MSDTQCSASRPGSRPGNYMIVIKGPQPSSSRDDVGPAMNAIVRDKPLVFVVADSADVRECLKALFESVGLDCKVFDSPKDFLSSPPENGPECLILDVRLPEM